MSVSPAVHARVMPVGPSTDDPDNFDAQGDAWVAEVRPFGVELNTLSDNVFANATDAAASATTASTRAGEAAASATAALISKNAAAVSVAAAHDSEVAAAASAAASIASAAASANSAAGITAFSATPLTLTSGTKAFTVSTNKQFLVGVPMVAVSAGTPAAKAFGQVASYTGTTLTLSITRTEGPAGTYSDWNIAPSGTTGPKGDTGDTGGIAGGQLTGALDEKTGTAPASSATPSIWNAGGNRVPITQTAAMSGLPNAPQAGAKRTLVAQSSFPLTSSANFLVVGGSTTINVGDELDIVADTVSMFRVTVRRNDGNAPSSFHNVEVLLSSQVWVAKYTGPHKITLIPPGASGGAAVGASGVYGVVATGASTAPPVIKTWNAVAGTAYTLVLGGFGVGVTASMSSGSGDSNTVFGNDAGASSFVGGDINLTSTGGKRGKATVLTSGGFAGGADAGTSSGGDFNTPGSPSGIASAVVGSGAATGGAASPYKGFAVPSGDASAPTLAGAAAASGGAGVGGKSGTVTSTTARAATGGGGYISASANASNNQSAAGTGLSLPTGLAIVMAPLTLGSAGTPALDNFSATGNATRGAGSGGITGTTSGLSSADSEMLGGTGAVVIVAGNVNVVGGAAIYGGSSGGVAVVSSTPTARATSGNGGAGFAIIETL